MQDMSKYFKAEEELLELSQRIKTLHASLVSFRSQVSGISASNMVDSICRTGGYKVDLTSLFFQQFKQLPTIPSVTLQLGTTLQSVSTAFLSLYESGLKRGDEGAEGALRKVSNAHFHILERCQRLETLFKVKRVSGASPVLS